MRADIQRTIRFVRLIEERPRVHISRIAEMLECSERTAYKWVQRASLEMPIRLENGVVIYCAPEGRG